MKDQTERFSVDSKAQITANGKPAKLADLKAGERVEVTYTGESSSMMANRISVLSSPHAT